MRVGGTAPASGLTTVEVPAGLSAVKVQQRVRDEHGVLVATGMGADAHRRCRRTGAPMADVHG